MTNLMTKLKTGIAMGAMVVGTLISASGAQADIIYNYTGNNFATGNMNARLEISLVTTAGFGNNIALSDVTALVTAFSLSVYDTVTMATLLNINDSNDLFFQSIVSTDMNQDILDWTISSILNNPSQTQIVTKTTGFFTVDVAKETLPTAFDIGVIFDKPGKWTKVNTNPAPSPEVTGLMLGGLGLMGFAALRRK